jgi:hypothetical protein
MTDPGRLLVAFDAAAHDPGALDVLTQVARALDAELAALIVQDVDLLRLAKLPFARELGAATAFERPLDAEQFAAALRARALRAERALLQKLRARGAELTLHLAEGKIVPAALAAATGSDFVLFAPAGQRPHAPARGLSRQGSIVLLLEDAPLPLPALRVATRLQHALNTPLSVLIAGAAQTFARLRDEAGRRLGSTAVRFHRIAAGESRAVVQVANRERAQLIVLPPASHLAEEESLVAVLNDSHCSVLWVR